MNNQDRCCWKISQYLFGSSIFSGKVMTSCRCQSFTFGGLNTESMAIFNALLTALGIKFDKTGHPVSMQGFVLTQISHGLQFSSSMKSYPSNSKLYALLETLKELHPAAIDLAAIILNLGRISFLKFTSFFSNISKKFWYSSNVTLFPFSYFPQSLPFFWIASLVRCMNLSSNFLSLNSLLDVLRQPSLQKYAEISGDETKSTKHLISNFLLWKSAGQIYCWMMQVRFGYFYDYFYKCSLISFIFLNTFIPLPRFDFSPGFAIHIMRLSSTLSYRQICSRVINYCSEAVI